LSLHISYGGEELPLRNILPHLPSKPSTTFPVDLDVYMGVNQVNNTSTSSPPNATDKQSVDERQSISATSEVNGSENIPILPMRPINSTPNSARTNPSSSRLHKNVVQTVTNQRSRNVDFFDRVFDTSWEFMADEVSSLSLQVSGGEDRLPIVPGACEIGK
jgi:hypothetical protein